MRKLDLVHVHSLGIEVGNFIAEKEEFEMEDMFDEYNDADVSGPHDVRAPKQAQQEAVFALFSDLTAAIDECSDADEEQQTEPTVSLSVA